MRIENTRHNLKMIQALLVPTYYFTYLDGKYSKWGIMESYTANLMPTVNLGI